MASFNQSNFLRKIHFFLACLLFDVKGCGLEQKSYARFPGNFKRSAQAIILFITSSAEQTERADVRFFLPFSHENQVAPKNVVFHESAMLNLLLFSVHGNRSWIMMNWGAGI